MFLFYENVLNEKMNVIFIPCEWFGKMSLLRDNTTPAIFISNLKLCFCRFLSL